MKQEKEQRDHITDDELQARLEQKSTELHILQRQLEIEAALEKVRTRTIAMQKSDELSETAYILFQQFKELGDVPDQVTIGIINEEERLITFWLTINGSQVNQTVNISIDGSAVMHKIFVAWKEQQCSLIIDLAGKELHDYINFRNQSSKASGIAVSNDFKDQRRVINVAFFSKGFLTFSSPEPRTPETMKVLERFAHEFDLTYTRFLDLKKAEAQSREAQIELGLERVRARAMAMKKSGELKELIGIVFTELTKLDLVLTRCLIMIYDPKTNGSTWWMANSEAPTEPMGLYIEYHEHHPYLEYIKAWKERNLKWRYILEGKVKREWDDFLFVETELAHLPDFVIAGMKAPDKVYLNASFNSFGNLTLATLQPLSNEHFDILLRFAKVFDLTYTRFSDLKRVEAQAREAQIEAALERVRSKAMAMQKSEDLSIAVATVFEELDKLNLGTLRCGIGILDKVKRTADVWTTTVSGNGMIAQVSGDESMDIHPLLQGAFEAWLKQEEDFSYFLEGEDLKRFYRALASTNFKLPDSQSIISEGVGLQQYYYVTTFQWGGLYAFRETAFPEEAKTVMKRFADVFNLTYTRFNDLQQAESLAKEATLEAALEKVRGRAMAMHTSKDLSSTASIIFTELRKLGISPIRCGVGLLNKDSRKALLYSATSGTDGDSLALMGWVILSGHPVLENIYDTWVKNKDYFPVLSGEQLKLYYELLSSGLSVPSLPDWQSGQKQYGHFFSFSVGCLYAWSENRYNEAEIKILKRFASIIDLTFRRYLELQKSEANAKEAVKRASLDRVRAEIASMRTTGDLERITPLIWNELTILGVPFIRCGVFIMDDAKKLIHTFLSTPDGKAIAAFHIPYTTPGNIAHVLSHWQHKEIYVDHWDEKNFKEFADTLVQQNALTSPKQYLSTIPHGGFYLHFLPFLQGMLYVGNTNKLSEEEIKLIQSVADAFSTAYARYEDFNKLELAKEQIEKTLVDLRQAQAQLIQAEKMASLGELTAGIAHEIQNPLNFVNNFSDVNKELLFEMKEELDNGNTVEAKTIADDIISNEEKINHHGKRADAIVKGMLQHSRSSTGEKEPTNINALADEYLRLSYHGLRAKDKSFNAGMKTDFDENIEKVNIVPQDIGRVLLNLYNNAFYAVTEKAKHQPENYTPTITVTTKKINNTVELTVKDNGNGVPQNIIDKIFQPFFTTKPTGEGTGLGLSLSYDIIKAHNGEMKVKTKEGEGSEFIIQLPAHINI